MDYFPAAKGRQAHAVPEKEPKPQTTHRAPIGNGGGTLQSVMMQMQRTVGNRAVGSFISRTYNPAIQRSIHLSGTEYADLTELTAAGYTFATPLEQEIVTALARANYKYDYDTQFENEVRMRVHLINAMHRIHEDSVKVGYNHEGDSLKLPRTEWKDVEASQEKGGRESDAAFQSKNAASTAIETIFEDKDESYYLECNTATVAMHYKALLDTIGQPAFDAAFSEVVIVPEWLKVKKGKEDAPSLELIPETEKAVKSLEDLVPGDWVYFLNYEDYPKMHPKGAFTGENALYIGNGKFRGFGVDEMSFDQMVAYLRAQYNQGLNAKKKKKNREASGEALDGQVPGIMKNVRRMAENDKVKDLLI